MDILFIIILSLLLDISWGEPPSFLHPVVYMGKIINFLKPHLIKYENRISGFYLTFLLLSLFVIPTYFIIQFAQFNFLIYIIISAIILSTTFAIKELLGTVQGVKKDIKSDINQARQSVSYLVSRDTTLLTKEELVSAIIETLTENITDSVVSPLFYTFFLGVLGGVAYRVINTLDAMVGYKNKEYINIGWFPARLDDLVNFLPARLTGILIIFSALLLGLNWRRSYHTMMKDAKKTPSPNSGYPMAAAAGALGIRLEKKSYYSLGESINSLNEYMIDQALLLSEVTIILFILLSFLIYIIIIYIIK
ncbi:MAG: cobalamin biosynthesis protein [Methanobacterium sp.]|jgi:adenosylcobinamide-phosphate synthase